MIRRAKKQDVDGINSLLYQVHKVHSDVRPDIFRRGHKKYTTPELLELLEDDSRPVFVDVDEEDQVRGYAFCIFEITKGDPSLCDRRVIYIDDLCVDEARRRQHIGQGLFAYVMKYAREQRFDSVTLHVWCLNEGAAKFYEACGFTPLKVMMEQSVR